MTGFEKIRTTAFSLLLLQSLIPPATPPPIIAPGALPDPAELGLTAWVNAYRSGDYVGRSLWLTEWYRRTIGGDNARWISRTALCC